MQLSGNAILITGGTSGIGLALAEALHARGNAVTIAGRRRHRLDAIIDRHPGMQAIAVDLADDVALDRFAAEARERLPDLNVLINNAGISQPEDLAGGTGDIAVARSIIRTNVTAVLQLTLALLPLLRAQPRATVMATTSGLAFLPLADFPTYCASKAFLHSWLQSLRAQLSGTAVEVLELIPPYVQTELTGAAQATDPQAMPLADYVAEVMALLENAAPPRGEILAARAAAHRWAERDGTHRGALAPRPRAGR